MVAVNEKVIVEKVEIVRRMLRGVGSLPLESIAEFSADFRMVAAGESMLRRSLEALLDIGRHILAKAFSTPVVEYKQIGRDLGDVGVLCPEKAAVLIDMAGYRNRLTHFYAEVTTEELYRVLKTRLTDIEAVVDEILEWLRSHPDMVSTSL